MGGNFRSVTQSFSDHSAEPADVNIVRAGGLSQGATSTVTADAVKGASDKSLRKNNLIGKVNTGHDAFLIFTG